MQVSEQQVQKFKRLYKKVYKMEITSERAMVECLAMVNLCKIVYKPLTQKDFNED